MVAAAHRLDMRIGSVDELFNAIDPAPFRERDLDPKAEEFIVSWAEELRADGPLALSVVIERPTTHADATMLEEAIRGFFLQRALATRRRLTHLMRRGRVSLLIGLAFLAASIALGDLAATALGASRFAPIVRESLLIGGWVAMWRPLEIFLYDWWPIRAEARRFDRLSVMTVDIKAASPGAGGAA